MSRRSGRDIEKKKMRRKTADGHFRGFVNHTLTREDKADYAQWALTVDLYANEVPNLLEDGYRLTLSVDRRTSAFMAAISTKESGSPNAQLVLTARAGKDPWEAASRAIFLHYHVLGEQWPDPSMLEDYVDEWVAD